MNFSPEYVGAAALIVGAILILVFSVSNRTKSRMVVRLAGFSWTRADFCRGWLITGDTGSGKTRSGITPLLFQVFQNEPTWGGLCIDDKGLYWETLQEMARHFGRENDLILLQVRPEGVGGPWLPRQTYNLTSDRSIPYNTFAKAVVDTASSLGQSGDKGFFRNQAQTHIAAALETLREIGADVTLENAYHLLLDQSDLDEALTDLASGQQSPRRRELVAHFTNRFLSQPAEQIGGVKETIANYLQAFITPEIAQIFCAGQNTFDFSDIDRGKIVCVAMPQKFQVERRYVNTFLKMLFYTHSLRRFDKPAEERKGDNLLILWADEAQRFVTASEEGMSDYNCIDVIREAQASLRLPSKRLLGLTGAICGSFEKVRPADQQIVPDQTGNVRRKAFVPELAPAKLNGRPEYSWKSDPLRARCESGRGRRVTSYASKRGQVLHNFHEQPYPILPRMIPGDEFGIDGILRRLCIMIDRQGNRVR